MPYRNIFIANQSTMRLKNSHLVVNNGGNVFTFPTVKTHEQRLKNNLPENGSVRLLVITERQYESMQILLGNYVQSDIPEAYEQLTFL
ncbi:MAG: hypothetical protein K6F09_00340 [Clostridiales bacterium]|nr:hypothetical protein [Clostridiales bacterium]